MPASADSLVKALENLILDLRNPANNGAGLGSRGIFVSELEKFVNTRIAQKVDEELDDLKANNKLK